jgi:serine/threonine-protein kinase
VLIGNGTIVGSYRVDGILGRGGMSVVYSARDLRLDRQVALKVLAEDLSSSTEFVERFRREGRLQASLDHPHAVRVYEAGESDYGLYLAMRLVGGTTLALLLQERAMDAARTIALLRQVGRALDAVHGGGLIHRDVKPQNILVDESSDAFLGDFGLARVGASPGLTATGRLMGTVAYLAPEVIRGHDATPASDRYSFAATAFECLTGTVVFPRGTEAAVLYGHMYEAVPKASERRRELPASLDEVFTAALAKEPADRPESARAFVDRVVSALEAGRAASLGPPEASIDALDAETVAPGPPTAPSAPPARGRRIGRLVLAAVVGAAVAVGAYALLRDGSADADAAAPSPLPGAVILGSDLSEPGETFDCRGRTLGPDSPECTIAQVDLPGARLVVPEDGVVRRWGVRSARGEISLAFLRPRRGGASQYARSQNEFAGNDGVFMYDTDLEVEQGDILGLVVLPGSAVGARSVSGATTERWLPHVGVARPPDFAAGKGFDRELLLRVEFVPGGKPHEPDRVAGAAAARLRPGRVVARGHARFVNGTLCEIDAVAVGKRLVLEERLGGVRIARIGLPGFRADGRIVHLGVSTDTSVKDAVYIFVEYTGPDSERILQHYYGADPLGFDFVD